MRRFSGKRLLLAAILVVLLFTACGRAVETTQVPPVSTLDISEIVDEVLQEVRNQEGESADGVEADAAAEAEADAIAARVLAQVQQELEAQQAEAVPVVTEDPLLEMDAGNLEKRLIELYQRANPSTVFIIVPFNGSGSGFVFDANGHIVTNNHVVGNQESFEVVFSNGERRQAGLVGRDVDSDLAVILVPNLPAGVQPLPLAGAGDIQVGQFVAAIGNPFGEQGSMSLGIVSGLDRSLSSRRDTGPGNNSYSLPEVIQTDAPINPGNSGGPLLNLVGEVVGVNSAIATTSGSNSGVGFSIPVAAVRQIIPSLIATGSFNYPFFGAGFDSEISLGEQSAFGLSQTQGAYVISIVEGGPADAAGLVPANAGTGRGGDLIVAIDGQAIYDFSDLNSYLVFSTEVGQTIMLSVLRAGEIIELPLTLGARP